MTTPSAGSRDALPRTVSGRARNPQKNDPRSRRKAVRVVLEIAETQYVVRRVACADPIGLMAFRLLKEDGTTYDVLQARHGAECDCPDFVFRRDGLDPDGCKHIQALVIAGMLPRAAPGWQGLVPRAAAIE